MPRYSAVFELEFDADTEQEAYRITADISNGEPRIFDYQAIRGHMSPHTLRLAEEPNDPWLESVPMGLND